MEVLYQQCAGLDVHKKNVKVCLITPGADGQPHKELRTFATTTQDLLQMHDWLHSQGCTHVAMESTGVYWKPIYNLFEGDFTLLVGNARHIKTVPGRKTDVKDAEWIADLLHHGVLHASFIPSAPQRELRDLTRYRTRLVEERAREINRLQKTLEDTSNWGMWSAMSWAKPPAAFSICWSRGKRTQLFLRAEQWGESMPLKSS
jgi:transposase